MWKFQRSLPYNQTIYDVTCYTHLKCDRGSLMFWCLDWREICDGKIDCSNDGIDEHQCSEVEIYECPIDQYYRCRNGQCIPMAFRHDNLMNPDCQDGSDERDWSIGIVFYECSQDPSFRCEERTCRHLQHFSCGDGECLPVVIPTSTGACSNHRGTLMSRSALRLSDNKGNFSYACWLATICLTRTNILFRYVECTKICGLKVTLLCAKFVRQHCPPEFTYPHYPVLLGHVGFIYSNDIWYNHEDFDGIWTPYKVCYREDLCDDIFHGIVWRSNGSICRLFTDLPLQQIHLSWKSLTTNVRDLFYAVCSPITNAQKDTVWKQKEAYFQCPNSTKRISTHKLLDNVVDCVDLADEKYNNSCSLVNQHRFQCKSDPDKCIPDILVLDRYTDCPDGEDEHDPIEHARQQRINFPTLCDAFQDRQNETLDGQIVNDETECERWECNNLYTRCDGFYNCPNGADELGCTNSSFNCSSGYQPCLSPTTLTMLCLPFAQAGDNIVDCLGATDERALCRAFSYEASYRYRCWNWSRCLAPKSVCEAPVCEYEDDNKFCDKYGFNSTTRSLCDPAWTSNRSASEELLCSLNEQGKPQTVYFSLQPRRRLERLPSSDLKAQVARRRTIRNALSDNDDDDMQLRQAWYCNRGILAYVDKEEHCLCPPAYYGSRCEYQNQRVSLTLQFLRESGPILRTVFHILLLLVADDGEVESHDSIIYVPVRDCSLKFNVYLLYRTRPKNPSKNYSVRVDAFDKKSMAYHASWLLTISFPFLPVHRLVAQLTIPRQQSVIVQPCALPCLHGQCIRYEDTDEFFCQCWRGWRGLSCHISYEMQCSSDSISVDSDICVCPLTKFGPLCYLTRSSCQKNTCANGGLCIPTDVRMAEQNFTCLCQEGYFGRQCELRDVSIEISFKDLRIPIAIRAHFITVQNDSDPLRLITFKKIPFGDDSVVLYNSKPFHIIFIEFDGNYYLSVMQQYYIPSTSISKEIDPSHRCLSIRELLNVTILTYATLRRVKYYHKLCKERDELMCFFDDTFMCLCNADRHANCFEFDHNMTYDCLGKNYCENGVECYQDDPSCPTTSMCICPECFYGTYCQFITKGFGLSLDAILGYHIQPYRTFYRQAVAVRLTAAFTIVMFIIGLINGSLCIITFWTKETLKTSCGFYLLASSITSLFTVSMFTLKFWLLFLTQMKLLVAPTAFSLYCTLADFFLKFSLNSGDWFTAFAAIERTLIAWQGINCDQTRRRRIAKGIIVFIVLATGITGIHDPLHRYLVDDIGEQRTWCIVRYSSSVQIYDTVMNVVHFILPFAINILSGILILVIVARYRTAVKKR